MALKGSLHEGTWLRQGTTKCHSAELLLGAVAVRFVTRGMEALVSFSAFLMKQN